MQKICAEVPPHFRSKKIYNKQFWEKEKYFPHQVQNFHLFCCLGSPESPLYWRHNTSQWYFSTLLEKCWLYVSIDSFEDFLVDQDRQFQNTPNSRVDSFRFFWTYIHPWEHLDGSDTVAALNESQDGMSGFLDLSFSLCLPWNWDSTSWEINF